MSLIEEVVTIERRGRAVEKMDSKEFEGWLRDMQAQVNKETCKQVDKDDE